MALAQQTKKSNDLDKYIKLIAKNINKPLVCCDCESTGVSTETDEIVQFAAVRINCDGSKSELSFICKPSIPISKGACDVHHISNDDVKDCQPFSFYTKDIITLFDGCDIAGYNHKRFDIPLLSRQLKQCGYELKDYLTFDAYLLYMMHSKRKLADCVEYYLGKEIQDAHTAMGDVYSTIKIIGKQILKELLPIHEIITKYEEESKKSALDGYITKDKDGNDIWLRGKYTGTKLKDLDKGFIKWVLDKDFPTAVKAVLSIWAK